MDAAEALDTAFRDLGREFRLEISDDDAENLQTVQDVFDYLSEHVK